MGEMRKRCRVCKVEKAASALDSTGRCQSCADAKAATDAAMTYGKYTELRREGLFEKQVQLQNRINRQRFSYTYCKNCGGIIPEKEKYDGFCCRECKVEWEKREQDAMARGASKEKPQSEPKIRVCRNCGAAVEGKKQYCGPRCKYVFNHERIMQQQKGYREKRKEEANEQGHTDRESGL